MSDKKFNLFKDKKEEKKKLSGNEALVKIWRITNSTYIKIGEFHADLKKDSAGNVVLESLDNNFKEDLNFDKDDDISDLILKLKNRFASKEEQLIALDDAIKKKETLIKNTVQGKVEVDEKGITKTIKINEITEKAHLNSLQATKYALQHEGEGCFECIEDNSKTYNYLVQDGLFYPLFYSAPKEKGKPVTAHPEVYQKKKLYKEAVEIFAQDYAESKHDPFKGWFIMAMRILFVLLFIGNILWAINNQKWSQDLNIREDKSASNVCIRTQAECAKALGIQIDANNRLINYAIKDLNRTKEEPDENTIKI